jgi:hypothetical protein
LIGKKKEKKEGKREPIHLKKWIRRKKNSLKRTGKIKDAQYGDFKNYKKIKAAWKDKDSGLNLYTHKDDTDEAKNYFVVVSVNKPAKDQSIKKFVVQYLQNKRSGEEVSNVETLKSTQATNSDGTYTEYRYYVKTTIGGKEEQPSDDNIEKTPTKTDDKVDPVVAKGGDTSTEKPVAKAGGGSGSKAKSGNNKSSLSGNFKKVAQPFQQGFEYLVDADTKDVYKINNKNGKVDTVYTFHAESVVKDLMFKQVMSENWDRTNLTEDYYTVKTSDGDKKMSGKFFNTIQDTLSNGEDVNLGGEDDSTKQGEPVVGGHDTPELNKAWEQYPCVKDNTNAKEMKQKDGSVAYKIGTVVYFSNGRAFDTKTKQKSNYECGEDGKPVVKGGNKPKTDGEEKPLEGNVITDVSVITGDNSWWANHFGMDRSGVKGLVDELDGWVDEDNLENIQKILSQFVGKQYKDPVSGKLLPALEVLKNMYKEDENEDLVDEINSVGTTSLSQMKLPNGTVVEPEQYKSLLVKMLGGTPEVTPQEETPEKTGE